MEDIYLSIAGFNSYVSFDQIFQVDTIGILLLMAMCVNILHYCLSEGLDEFKETQPRQRRYINWIGSFAQFQVGWAHAAMLVQ